MLAKFNQEGRPYPPATPYPEGHTLTTEMMNDVAGPPKDPTRMTLSAKKPSRRRP